MRSQPLVPLVPRPEHPDCGSTTQSGVPSSLSSTSFSQTDVAYFDLFRHRLIFDLGGDFLIDFWARIVLRESMRDECVKRAVIALSALAHGLFFTTEPRLQCDNRISPFLIRPWTGTPFNIQHGVAIRSYLSAISLCSKRIREGAYISSPRSALIITIILVSFELLQGNINVVDRLIKSAILLLKKSTQLLGQPQESPGKALRHGTNNKEEDMDQLGYMLPCLSVMSGFTNLCNSQHELLTLLPTSPKCGFPDLSGKSVPKAMGIWIDFHTQALVFIKKVLWKNCHNIHYDHQELKASRDVLLVVLQKWGEWLHTSHAKEKDAVCRRALSVTKVHHAMITMFMHCCLDRSDMSYDHFEPQLRYILTASIALMSEHKASSKIPFTCSGHLAPPLCLGAAKCRNWELRAQFMKAIAKLPRREGPWDPTTQILGLTGQARLEDAGRDAEGFLPSTSRWLWTGASWDLDHHQLFAQYTRIVPDTNGMPVQTQIALSIDDLDVGED